MLVTVILHGILASKFPKKWELNIASASEAIRAIACQTPGFREFLECNDQVAYRVVSDDPQGMLLEDTVNPLKQPILHIYPEAVLSGGGWGRIILGAALIAVAFLVPGGVLGVSAMTIGLIGASLMFSGISQLLTPTPKKPGDNEKQESSLFGRGEQTNDQGSVISIRFGRRRAKNMIIASAGITVQRINL